jgi:hypothetical protein
VVQVHCVCETERERVKEDQIGCDVMRFQPMGLCSLFATMPQKLPFWKNVREHMYAHESCSRHRAVRTCFAPLCNTVLFLVLRHSLPGYRTVRKSIVFCALVRSFKMAVFEAWLVYWRFLIFFHWVSWVSIQFSRIVGKDESNKDIMVIYVGFRKLMYIWSCWKLLVGIFCRWRPV